MELLKNIIINCFVILLAYIKLAHLYSILFLNDGQLFVSPGIFATFAMTFSSSTGSSTWPLLLSLNLINLNLLWVD